MVRRQDFQRPPRGAACDGVESVRLLDSARDLVVIPADDRPRLELLYALDHRIGIGAVADEVAEHQRAIEAPGLGVGQARLEGLEVRMDVGENQITPRIRLLSCLMLIANDWFARSILRKHVHLAAHDCSQSRICSTSPSTLSRLASSRT